MDQPTILIVSDESAFAHVLKTRWQNEAPVPAFTLMTSDLCRDLDMDAFAMAIVGPVRPDALPLVLNALNPEEKSIIVVCETSAQAQALRDVRSRCRSLIQQEGWPDVLVMIASETLLRQAAVLRVRHLEQANHGLTAQAALGSYVLEMRHSLNNALTSILGNTELLLLDSEPLPTGARAQMETMHNMAVRIHEIFARFSSIHKELSTFARPLEAATGKSRSQTTGAIH